MFLLLKGWQYYWEDRGSNKENNNRSFNNTKENKILQ